MGRSYRVAGGLRAAAAVDRSPARASGMLSGACTPPEMMNLIAWSTVQWVGVSSSTDTISR